MKLYPYLGFIYSLLLSTILFSCQFSSSVKEQKKDKEELLSSKNPDSLSAALHIWKGQRIQGEVPSLPISTLVQVSDRDTVPGIIGKTILIDANVFDPEGGFADVKDIKGYFIKIKDAHEYFKIDLTNNRSDTDDVIQMDLKSNLKMHDTICINYWAYDKLNHISNKATVWLYLNELAANKDNEWLYGTWNATSKELIYEDGKVEKDTFIYKTWVDEIDSKKIYNHNDSLFSFSVKDSQFNYLYDNTITASLSGTDIFLGYESQRNVSAFTYKFKKDGAFSYDYIDDDRNVNDKSTAEHLIYDQHSNMLIHWDGWWGFDAPTQKIVLIGLFEGDATSVNSWLMLEKINDKKIKIDGVIFEKK